MNKMIIDFSPFDSTRVVTLEYYEAAKRLAAYANKNRSYKKSYLSSSECEFTFKVDSKQGMREHRLSEMRAAGDYFNTTASLPVGLTWREAGIRGRAAHNTKRDIGAEERKARQKAMEHLPPHLVGKARTWSAATALINENSEAKQAYEIALAEIEEEQQKELNNKKKGK